MQTQVYLIRHGETEWSASGQHTSRTDLPLTDGGRATAARLAPVLAPIAFAAVLTSPMQRARETCRLAGLDERATVDADLVEWQYGDYEGLTQAQIQSRAPGWVLFDDGGPGGESPAQITERVDRVIAKVRAVDGPVALFAHGHVFRVLAVRWIGLPTAAARHFLLDTATLSILGAYRGEPTITRWNAVVTPPATSDHLANG